MSSDKRLESQVEQFRERYRALHREIGKVIVGHDEIVHGVLTSLFVGGHCLIEGVPGLGKTLLVRTLAQVLSLKFSRIQFTPDLMPSDILGTNMIAETPEGRRVFEFHPGPIFTQICLADEINRATPKTQSALLETMQEGTVTISGVRRELQTPFLVMATQNPIEQEGTYPLPEAQLDRFLLKLLVNFVSRDELKTILARTTGGTHTEVASIMDGEEIKRWQKLVREVIVADHVSDFAARLVLATHPNSSFATKTTSASIRWGASPRGAQAMLLAAKVRALLDGRYNASFEDIRVNAHAALRHRIVLNFEAQAESVQPDEVISRLLSEVPDSSS
jgi:MoxR-like ATPase